MQDTGTLHTTYLKHDLIVESYVQIMFCLGNLVATFKERAAYSVNHRFSLGATYCVLIISYFGYGDRILALIGSSSR